MRVQILSAATRDLAIGRDFYEFLELGLGDYFLDSLASDIDSLLLYAGIHRQVVGYYRCLSKRFPYAIYYRVDGDDIQVHRILDCRQNPVRIRRELRGG